MPTGARWMTYYEISAALRISSNEARQLVQRLHCPKVFRQHEDVVLIDLAQAIIA